MYRQTKKNQGFTLIEVLISVLILGMGILGVLNLQTRALMDNQDAYLRTQAILLAYDMSDRIRANAPIWRTNIATVNNLTQNDASGKVAGTYTFCSSYDPVGALADPLAKPLECTATVIAQYDSYRWRKAIKELLNGTATITAVNDPVTSGATLDILRLTISWARVNQEMQNKLKKGASYSLDVRP